MPPDFEPAAVPPVVDIKPLVGNYRREGVLIRITEQRNKLHLVYEFVDGMKDLSPPIEADLIPVSENVFAAAGTGSFSNDWMPVVFSTLANGTQCCYIGMRCAPKIN